MILHGLYYPALMGYYDVAFYARLAISLMQLLKLSFQ
jgi:hypothetical protein